MPTPVDPNGDIEELALRALLSGIHGRDEATLAKLYDATASQLYTLALRMTGEVSAAEEVVADVYFQVWEHADRFDPSRGRVKAWLYMLCRSRALDALRRARRQHCNSVQDVELVVDDDPVATLVGLHASQAVTKALRKLSGQERHLLSLAYFRGLSHQEIADFVQMPLGSVKTCIRRATLTLRQVLDPDWNPAQEA
jgi:RNA polymerase sigma factor (sigma-70 family)